MSERYIYWEDPLTDTFEVTIKSCKKGEDGHEVIIDEHVVRPEGGGQAGDRGTLEVDDKIIRFNDTVERDGDLVLICENSVKEGPATLHIDMDWRRSTMRNHSAEHLFVSRMKRIHNGAELGYIWIDGERGTVDVHGQNITLEEIFEAERQVQEIVAKDIPVQSRVIPASELDESIRAREGVTRKHGDVRVISFGEYDSSACSGTHVLSTGDIGLFKVINCKFLEGRVRVEFTTGPHAVRRVSSIYNEVLARKNAYPFEMEQIGAILDRSKRVLMERNMLVEKVENLITTYVHGEDINGVSFIAELMPGFETGDLRRILKKISFKGKMAVLLFVPGNKSNFIFAVNDLGREAKEVVDDIVKELGGRGGGSKDVFTGGFTNVDEPQTLFEKLREEIRKSLAQ